MPVDDHPFDALEKQFQIEKLTVSPVTEVLLRLGSIVKLEWPFGEAIATLKANAAADSLEKVRLMLETCMAQVRKLEVDVGELRSGNATAKLQSRERVAGEVMLDAARKAAATRSRERVRHIGLILANSIVESKPPDGDEVEEMMRVATELSDNDLKYLRELVRIEGDLLEARDHIPRYDAHMKWEQGFWGDRVVPEVDSAFSKLESYGLVSRVAPPNNLNVMADFQNRYVLLKKGARFVNLVRQAVGV